MDAGHQVLMGGGDRLLVLLNYRDLLRDDSMSDP